MLAERGVVARRDGHADDGKALGEEAEATEVEEGGDELALGQVAGGAEDDEDAGRSGLAVVGGIRRFVRHEAASLAAARGALNAKSRAALLGKAAVRQIV